MTDSIRFAIGESSPVKVRFSLTNSMRTPRRDSFPTMRRRSSRLRARRSMLWTPFGFAYEGKQPFRLWTLRGLARSLVGKDLLEPGHGSGWRSGFWSKLLTRTVADALTA